MTSKEILELQTQRGARIVHSSSSNIKTIDTVIKECRAEIKEQSDKYRNLRPEEKTDAIKQIIISYVMDTKPMVIGFITEDNNPDTLKLVDKLVEDITDYGILANAMSDERVYEIRANGKEIKVEIKGKVQDLTDKDGNIISFETVEQQEIILRKLLGDVKLTPKDQLVNSRTIEGYRIAAVHSSAMSPDPNEPLADAYHSFVLRKFKKDKMTLGEIVRNYGTMSDNMARLLALCAQGGLVFMTVGPTASGKTTTNNAILQAVPPTKRTIVIQNPSEIDLRAKDATGRVFNDVLHLEASEKENPTPQDATMKNEMDHILRLSPTFVALGEIRTDEEFKQCMKILLAGHPVNATYHSETSAGAIQRFLTAYLAESGNQPSHLALANIATMLNIVIVQKILNDGTRKIIQISEIVGVKKDNKDEAEINDLYIFDTDEDPVYDEAGNVVEIKGKHKRVGKLSPSTIKKLSLEGIAKSRYDFLLKDVDPNEVEEYTGNNIEKYGINII